MKKMNELDQEIWLESRMNEFREEFVDLINKKIKELDYESVINNLEERNREIR